MSERDPDPKVVLGEVETHASTVGHALVEDAVGWADDNIFGDEAKRAPAAILAYSAAAAIVYQAERQVDAADRIRDGLLAVAESLQSGSAPSLIERLAGVENELFRLANTVGDAFKIATDPARKKGRGDGGK